MIFRCLRKCMLSGSPLPVQSAARASRDLLSALSYLEHRNILHRVSEGLARFVLLQRCLTMSSIYSFCHHRTSKATTLFSRLKLTALYMLPS